MGIYIYIYISHDIYTGLELCDVELTDSMFLNINLLVAMDLIVIMKSSLMDNDKSNVTKL